ncbi:FAD-binding and (Fe-S)-binding domain-containing protein [Parafrigoribacterium humi]|uniref:FAD-binding and (Fe-S)-binding domain-containing protein n=1 Tax=Parafrigoribacterium humi TaxID=3144664 RepID=UPI0032EE7A69
MITARRDVTVDPELLTALETAVPGRVDMRASRRLALAHDASHYLLTPRAVVSPVDTGEVASLLRTSSQRGTEITFRSGGTSLSGQAVSDGVLVDTRRHFRGIEVLDGGARVRVQPGMTVRQVNARLSPHKRKLGPDPASEAACTIGGVVANNSSGMACGIEFNTYQTLESATLVLPSGTVIDTGAGDADTQLLQLEPELYRGLLTLRDRVRNNSRSVDTVRKLYSIKNTMGYGLNSFLDHDSATDILAHLVVGSEGTLAFVAEATFRTIPVKTHAATGLLVFDDLGEAVRALPELVAAGLATVELLDSTSLKVAQRDKEADATLRGIDVGTQAALLVEYQETEFDALQQRMAESERLFSGLPLQFPARLTEDAKARAALWHIRKGLYAAIAGNRPVGTSALLEDIAVPMTALLDTCEHLTQLFTRYGYEDSVIFGHAKDGNLHFMLNESFGETEKLERYIAFTEDMVQLVLSGNGTLKAEHGTGRVMAPFVRRQYGDELYAVMQEVKRLCDPHNVLNPGVLLNEDATSAVQHLKVARPIEKEVDRCVECGYCEPVCPSKDLTLTPRQRIVLRRELADAEAAGDLGLVRSLEADYRYEGVDTCAVDGMCQTACPVDIDTGDLVRRLRAEANGSVAQAGWKQAARHWSTVTKLGGVALSAAKALPAPLVTGATAAARAIMGTDNVPLWQKDLPSGGTARKDDTDAQHPQFVYFSACIGTMFGPAKGSEGVGRSLVELCERAGVEMVVPAGIQSMCCGTPWKSKGMTHGYNEMRSRVMPALWEASRHGELPVVVDAASCTEGLGIMVSGSADMAIQYPAIRVIDAIEFVDEVVMPLLTVRHRIESLSLHPTCSSTHLGTNDALSRLSKAIADEVVVPDDWGCCGFAGDRGMLHPELTASATKREAVNVQQRQFTAYASTNRTCEIGMSRATGHEYRHLLELVNEATR